MTDVFGPQPDPACATGSKQSRVGLEISRAQDFALSCVFGDINGR